MTREEIIEKVNEFLVEEFEVDGSLIKPEAPLQETLDLDSLDYVDLVVVIESNFGFKVQGEDFVDIKTFDDFYTYAYNKYHGIEMPKKEQPADSDNEEEGGSDVSADAETSEETA
jgi:acyl carrier protein